MQAIFCCCRIVKSVGVYGRGLTLENEELIAKHINGVLEIRKEGLDLDGKLRV